MTIFQALLIAFFCVIGGNEFPLYGTQFGWYVLSRPLIGGFICGLILGDMSTGIQLGVAVQLVYLALVTPGGSIPIDLSFVSYTAMAIAITSHMNSGATVALASTIGVIGAFVKQLNDTLGSFFHKGQDIAIANADYKKYNRYYWLYPQLVKFITRGIPSFIAVYFGANYVNAFLKAMPSFIQNGLMILGTVLPAVGIATLLLQSVHKNSFILFFLVGFIGIVFMKLNILGLTVFGGALAFLYYLANQNMKNDYDTNSSKQEKSTEEEIL